ncbi:putative B3 domain-containing protein At1g78640 [Rhodamnia argentea]|uniref:B3 domain-containing protein At1g78640 n=1 Tax=Rhodamnia argentea TaxID=178133 RepID=A0A8B8N794_9MYRT|nr:putative B3 domain-containing protein At1g78640 [Rhodamnia argentea]
MKLIDFFGPKSPPTVGVLGGAVHSLPLMDSSACVSSLHDHEKKPISDHLGGKFHSLQLTDSSSCLSHLHHQEKNHDEGARDDVSSAVEVVAINFFPLTPDPKGFSDAKVLKKEASEGEDEEERCGGVLTELTLLCDPYKIKKKLTKSNLGHLSRLLIPRAGVLSHVLPCMSKERVEQVESEGAKVVVWDADTRSEHRLVFVYWISSKSYVLKGGWNKVFVQRKGLADGDEIGIYWDPIVSRFVFSLLRKAN